MSKALQGVLSVLPTPFFPDGSIDHESLRCVVDLYIAAGVDGLTALGVTSEAASLNERERSAVLKTVVDQVAGRVGLVVGTTAAGLDTCIEYTKAAREAGAAAVMVSPPRLQKLSSATVLEHFERLAHAVDTPIVIQDYPPVSGITMEPFLLARIARKTPAAGAIKLEDSPTPLKTTRILEAADGASLQILGGLGGAFLLEELTAGAAGTMTGFAFPEILVDVVRRYRAGDEASAADIFYRYVPLMRFEFQQGIGIALRKEILRRRGAITNPTVRAPAPSLDRSTLACLDRLWRWLCETQEEPWISA